MGGTRTRSPKVEVCGACLTSFSTQRQLQLHLTDNHAPTFQGTFTNAQGAVETSTLSRVEGVFRCPRCQQSFGTQSGIRKHLKRGNCKIADGCSVLDVDVVSENGKVEEGGTSNNDEVYEPPTKKTKLPEAELAAAKQEIVKNTAKILPLEMVKFVTTAMNIAPFLISEDNVVTSTGFTVFLERNCMPLLTSRLQPGFSITQMDLDDSCQHLSLKDGHEEMGSEHLTAVESGGAVGLERLSGALLVTGSKTAKILCLEGYGRDVTADPHAESMAALPSSVPTRSQSTQYNGRLKLVILLDNFRNKRLVIGVRDSNYLVTALEWEKSVEVGPSRCAEFPINNSSRIFVSKERNGSSLVDKVLGLAQVRSHFGHRTTYTTRRGALEGCASISQLPLTVFTLWLWEIPLSKVFHCLWIRSKEDNHGIVLHLSDVDNPAPNDQRPGAKACRSLRELFHGSDRLDISSSKDAEEHLTSLAGNFSSIISNRNRTVASRIMSE
ncbi:hypothetical protein BGX30_006116 [Mortierella sp. GBA39]|nr:hypothetical protein BGX30_006116 [Mortierella sp. GBA39]